MSEPAQLVFVHHANQFLITDGYVNRDGISRIAEGYERILLRHEEAGVPAGLHISGTLLEALAWYRPRFLELVKRLIDRGVISLIGGTYADNVMTEWPPDFNRRQLVETFASYDDLLGCPPEDVTTFWLPERVWDEDLSRVLTDTTLPNSGYRAVLLDDRLLFSPEPGYDHSPRARFDATGPYEVGVPESSGDTARVCRIAGTDLLAIPISADLRYWVPPRGPRDWARIKRRMTGSPNDLFVFADDLERTAGVGGWQDNSGGFCRLLDWVASGSLPVAVRSVHDIIDRGDVRETRVHRGAFFELERTWRAGDDYRGWTGSEAWAPCKRIYDHVLATVRAAEGSGADPRLVELAWKHLLASAHETGWHDPVPGEATRAPAPWATALASHSRAALVMVDAGRRLLVTTSASVAIEDVDDDGDNEIALHNRGCYALITPRFGARLLYMFHRADAGSALSVGNPTDHWNFQQSLNRHMECPPNHPCAFTDAGGENDPYVVADVLDASDAAGVELVNAGAGPLRGLRKAFLLLDSPPGIVVCYRMPGAYDVETQVCLSPDYLALLRTGRRRLQTRHGNGWTAVANHGVRVWFGSETESVVDVVPTQHAVGHGIGHALRCEASHFHIAIGWGDVNDDICRELLAAGARRIHSLVKVEGSHEQEVLV
jgi:starch synthase